MRAFQHVYCLFMPDDKAIHNSPIFSASDRCGHSARSHTHDVLQFIFAADKRFVGVEAKITAKMNCRIFDIFDLTEASVVDVRFGVVSCFMHRTCVEGMCRRTCVMWVGCSGFM